MWKIRRTDGAWEVVRSDGDVLTVVASLTASGMPDTAASPNDQHRREYGNALRAMLDDIAELADLVPTEGEPDGLLPDVWEDSGGIAFSLETGDGRDFTSVQWTFRDPSVSLMPLMLQTETDVSHFGAELAGFIATITDDSGTVRSTGRFYDNETGLAARNLLLGGRRFGVSVDPGHVAATWQCMAEDEEGWCEEEKVSFTEYEIIGVTMTPFPAFAEAAIQLQGVNAPAAVGGDGAETMSVSESDGGDGLAAVDGSITDHEFSDNGSGFCDYCVTADDNGD